MGKKVPHMQLYLGIIMLFKVYRTVFLHLCTNSWQWKTVFCWIIEKKTMNLSFKFFWLNSVHTFPEGLWMKMSKQSFAHRKKKVEKKLLSIKRLFLFNEQILSLFVFCKCKKSHSRLLHSVTLLGVRTEHLS